MWKKLFHNEDKVNLDIKSISKGHHNVRYRGIKAIRSPFDYLLYQMIIFEVMPDLVIEVGTNSGGGALYIADLMDIMGKGVIHTIDISDHSDSLVKNHPRIKTFTDGWENYNTQLINGFEKILVIEDSSHTYSNTIGALNKFGKYVTKGSYLIVEDGIINELGMKKEYDGGPLEAIKEFLKINNDYIVDRRWCDFFGKNATFNVNGYLRKI